MKKIKHAILVFSLFFLIASFNLNVFHCAAPASLEDWSVDDSAICVGETFHLILEFDVDQDHTILAVYSADAVSFYSIISGTQDDDYPLKYWTNMAILEVNETTSFVWNITLRCVNPGESDVSVGYIDSDEFKVIEDIVITQYPSITDHLQDQIDDLEDQLEDADAELNDLNSKYLDLNANWNNLNVRYESLVSKLNFFEILTYVSLIIGAIGLLVGLYALMRARKK